MNIIEVMNSLQVEVGYARRPCWLDGVRLVRSNESNIEIVNFYDEKYPNSEVIWDFTCEDLSADDWIVMDGKECL